jgi:Domain of unknown function (DUF4259)
MGAWGHGSFENDDAADWVHEFELQGASAVVPAQESVSKIPEDEYLEAPEASVAIAAAEIVAAARERFIEPPGRGTHNFFPTSTQTKRLASLGTLSKGRWAHSPAVGVEGLVGRRKRGRRLVESHGESVVTTAVDSRKRAMQGDER